MFNNVVYLCISLKINARSLSLGTITRPDLNGASGIIANE